MKDVKIKNEDKKAIATEQEQKQITSIQEIYEDKKLSEMKDMRFDFCGLIGNSINNYLNYLKEQKLNTLEHCNGKDQSCSCIGPDGGKCKQVRLPSFEPCVSIAWGDSDCDCFETDDVEVAMISICNCYSNITFSDVRISYLYVTMADGSPVPLMPDGTPSVQVIPVGPICFGDVGPCIEGGNNCVSREIVIRTRGAKSGKYRINVVGICYEVVLKQLHNTCLELELCKD